MKTLKRIGLGLLTAVAAVAIVVGAWLLVDPGGPGRLAVRLLSNDYAPRGEAVVPGPRGDTGPEAIAIELERVASGIEQPTDIVLSPAFPRHALVASKQGSAHWLSLSDGRHGVVFSVPVVTVSEQGLLGIALHPRYAENGRLFTNHTVRGDDGDESRVVEWQVTPAGDLEHASARQVKTLMRVPQPYQNHNAGQLAFGPDGMLYVGWGDGGLRDDPNANGQNPATLLGTMLRIDVDRPAEPPRAYAVPPDNPFVGKPGHAPELFAYGLRNPWRFCFDPRGRLVVADVGQDAWEEIDLVAAGDNLGWPIMEGFVCHADDRVGCDRTDLTRPIHVYGRGLGNSITGGLVYTGARIPGLRGKYVFADFGSGRLFALELPDTPQPVDAVALGAWPLRISAFGRDPAGELYLAAYSRGEIYRLVPPAGTAPTAAGDGGPPAAVAQDAGSSVRDAGR